MKQQYNLILPSLALVIAAGFLQPGLARQAETNSTHEGHGQSVEATTGLQSSSQDADAQSHQHDGQREMMQRRQGNGQGEMMQGRQGNGQGEMTQGHQGNGQGGMMQNQGNGNMMQRMQQMRQRMGMSRESSGSPGTDILSNVGALIDQLEQDPDTDWSQVSFDALRQHLTDMQEVVFNAQVEASDVEGGARFIVTGEGRTLAAIRRMVPDHAARLSTETDWTAEASDMDNGVQVTVTATAADQVGRIRALGFLGFMASGDHHDRHHLAIVGGQETD